MLFAGYAPRTITSNFPLHHLHVPTISLAGGTCGPEFKKEGAGEISESQSFSEQPQASQLSFFNDLSLTYAGNRSWQPLGEGINGHKNFRKRVFTFFATNASFFCVIANSLIQLGRYNISCKSAFLVQEKHSFCPKMQFFAQRFPKNALIAKNLNIATK